MALKSVKAVAVQRCINGACRGCIDGVCYRMPEFCRSCLKYFEQREQWVSCLRTYVRLYKLSRFRPVGLFGRDFHLAYPQTPWCPKMNCDIRGITCRVLGLAAILFALTACPLPAPTLTLYNHTSDAAQVSVDDKTYAIGPANSVSFVYPVSAGGSIGICQKGEKRTYKPSWPSEYMDHWRVSLQLENDGSLRVLQPSQEFPAGASSGQPQILPSATEPASCH